MSHSTGTPEMEGPVETWTKASTSMKDMKNYNIWI
ncbi:hypothetical protein COLO4_20079 [Corchorus olitorius]|uniref:Uncharacterized protein n=1 Tax=Corchorus olitorius TaxID=93759 RepID=A0A1R3J1W3_9ROSI|nr:hypothetical protein COLO4_20079 [Corchorus olitorius]